MTRESCHLSIRFVDLYLSREECPIERLQLLGAGSLLIACKMEEIVCPRVGHFAYATDNGFTERQIVEMEAHISKALGFRLQPSTIAFWGNYYLAKFDVYSRENPEGFNCLQTNH
jgi:G2/mitotic-specific cyclin 1/2